MQYSAPVLLIFGLFLVVYFAYPAFTGKPMFPGMHTVAGVHEDTLRRRSRGEAFSGFGLMAMGATLYLTSSPLVQFIVGAVSLLSMMVGLWYIQSAASLRQQRLSEGRATLLVALLAGVSSAVGVYVGNSDHSPANAVLVGLLGGIVVYALLLFLFWMVAQVEQRSLRR